MNTISVTEKIDEEKHYKVWRNVSAALSLKVIDLKLWNITETNQQL